MRIAFFHTGIGEGTGGGGAGRFFVDLFQMGYNENLWDNNSIFFITDLKSYNSYTSSMFFNNSIAKSRFIYFPMFRNRFKKVLEKFVLIVLLLYYKFDLIHICQYYPQDYEHLIKFINVLPKWLKPKVVVNFIHCNFAHEYNNPEHPNYLAFHERFDALFNKVKIDAVFSWYELFKNFAKENQIFKYEPYIYAIKTYCCNTNKFKPSPKQNIIVFASRLDLQKNPMMFLRAIQILKNKNPEILKEWKIIICGKGPLENEIRKFIKGNCLEDVVEFKNNISDMSPIFSISKCFVSTQDYENFTSLSMHEAMASGNALIARNVGQTQFYLKDGKNGILVKNDSAEGLAESIERYLLFPELHKQMQDYSLYLTREVHNNINFTNELKSFWKTVINFKNSNKNHY